MIVSSESYCIKTVCKIGGDTCFFSLSVFRVVYCASFVVFTNIFVGKLWRGRVCFSVSRHKIKFQVMLLNATDLLTFTPRPFMIVMPVI